MIRLNDAYLTTDAFDFKLDPNEIVQMSFGPTCVCMSVDAALDLQYRLAAFLAVVELRDYPDAEASEPRGQATGRENLVDLTQRPRNKRIIN